MTDLAQLKDYIGKVTGYILGDIGHLREKGVTVSFPYLLLSFAGIDFLGGLEHGFARGNSRMRSCRFIANWMSKINSRYLNSLADDTKSQASYLYNFARSGLIHMACVQRSVIVDTDPSWEQYHLCYSTEDGSKVFIHPILFAEEFKKASELFLSDLYGDESKISRALDNISKYFTDSVRDESEFTIPSIFQLAQQSISEANTKPSGSANPAPSMGTQSPSQYS